MRQLWVNFQLFWEGAVLSYRALFAWLRPSTFIASMIVMPLGQIMFFTLLGIYATGPQNASFFLIGNAMQITASSGIFGVTMAIGGERWAGTLVYLFGAPANRLAVFFGRATVHILNGFLEVLMGLAWGWLLGWVDFAHTDPLALGLTILIATFSTAALGLLLGCLGLITLNIMFINNLVYFLLLLFSGANVPIASLPQARHPGGARDYRRGESRRGSGPAGGRIPHRRGLSGRRLHPVSLFRDGGETARHAGSILTSCVQSLKCQALGRPSEPLVSS